MSRTYKKDGHSLMEMLVAICILGMVIAGAMSGWLFVVYGEKQNSIQDKLDLDVRMALENIRRDLRLTTMSKMFFYPAGPGPYEAISFPMALDNNGDGLIELDSNTNIIWDLTKIYHRYGTGMEFRVTTITNRDNTLTDAQRQAQIDSVAQNGNAQSTYEAAKASTRTIFKNLFTWNVTPDGAVFDGYASSLTRVDAVSLGSTMLSNGMQSFKFNVIGKNPSATGYKIGLDTMAMSVSGGQREMEKQTIAASSGATPATEYFTGGSWSENQTLAFPASATGHYVTLSMENDRWEDTCFGGDGSDNAKCIQEFDTTFSPKEHIVRLDGNGYTWSPDHIQAWSFTSHWDSADTLTGCAVRVLLRGGQMTNDNGSWLNLDGKLYGFWFDAGEDNLHILDARIAEAANHEMPGPDIANAGVQLTLSGGTNYDIGDRSFVFATPATSFHIDKEKSYVVSYLVSKVPGKGNARYYHQIGVDTPAVCSYIIAASNAPTAAKLRETAWSDEAYDTSTNLYGVAYSMQVLYVSNGWYQSAVYDTHQSNVTYNGIDWSVDNAYYASTRFKVRTGNMSDMSDAPAWSNRTWITTPGTFVGSGRYVQYLAELTSSSSGWETPRLKYVTIRFNGTQKIIDIGGAFAKGPNYGIFEMLVNGVKLQRGVTINMMVYDDMPVSGGGSKRILSQSSVEVEPRNTGR